MMRDCDGWRSGLSRWQFPAGDETAYAAIWPVVSRNAGRAVLVLSAAQAICSVSWCAR